jgi:radical SAM protein with 4Fe4S-binding SPASM domain
MTDLIVVAILLVIVVAVLLYIRRAKRSGAKCIGCPYAKQCGGNCSDKNKSE